MYQSLPFNSFERKLRAVIFGLIAVFLVFGAVPSVATNGVCAFLPCDPALVNTAAFGVTGSGQPLLFLPACLGDITAITVESDPSESDRSLLWSMTGTSLGPRSEELVLERPPDGVRVDQPLVQALPTDQDLLIRVTSSAGTYYSYASLAGVTPGLVSASYGSTRPQSPEEFRSSACAEVADVRPRPPDIVIVGAAAVLAVPVLVVWLVVHHEIRRRTTPAPSHA